MDEVMRSEEPELMRVLLVMVKLLLLWLVTVELLTTPLTVRGLLLTVI